MSFTKNILPLVAALFLCSGCGALAWHALKASCYPTISASVKLADKVEARALFEAVNKASAAMKDDATLDGSWPTTITRYDMGENHAVMGYESGAEAGYHITVKADNPGDLIAFKITHIPVYCSDANREALVKRVEIFLNKVRFELNKSNHKIMDASHD